jgi:hypothetical protein
LLPGDDQFAVDANAETKDVVSVEGGLVPDVLGSHYDFFASIHALFLGVSVHDDSDGCCHVDGFTLVVVVEVVGAVVGTVAVNVLDLEL